MNRVLSRSARWLRRRGGFVRGTVILTGAAAVVKILSGLFTIPLTNLYGAEGSAIFSLAWNVYVLMLTLSTSGLPMAVSKMVSEAHALGRHLEVRRIGRIALAASAMLGILLSAVLVWGADAMLAIARNTSARYAVLAIAPCIFFTCLLSAVRGYYQGLSNMGPTALSQILEAAGKLVFGLGLAYWLARRGYGVEIVVAGAMAGVTLGTAASALCLLAARLSDARHHPLPRRGGQCQSVSSLLKRLLRITLPVTLAASILSLIHFVDGLLVPRLLQDLGRMTESAAFYLYGAYGMAGRFFSLPQTLLTGISVSIIPVISRAVARGGQRRIRQMTESAFRLTGVIVFPAALGLAVLARPLMNLFYFKQPADVAVAAPLLTLFGPGIALAGIANLSIAILQAAGKGRVTLFSMTAGGVLKLATTVALVGNAHLHIYGAPVATAVCYGAITLINLVAIRRHITAASPRRMFGLPLLSAAVMGLFARLVHPPLAAALGGAAGTLTAVALSGVIYVLMLAATKALPREDVLLLPKGRRMADRLGLM